MSPRKSESTTAHGNDANTIRTTVQWLREVERATGGVVNSQMGFDVVRHTLKYRYELQVPREDGSWEHVCSYEGQYPNVHPRSLAAELFNGIIQLDRLARESLGVEPVKVRKR